MGALKELWMDMMEMEKEEWIRSKLGDNADEKSDEWFELEEEYDFQQAFYRDQAELQEEQEWHKAHNFKDIYAYVSAELKTLQEILESDKNLLHEKAYYKMIYVHSVTLMESYLSETLKSLIVSDNTCLVNAVKGVEELKQTKPSLDEILQDDDIVIRKVLEWLPTVLFHNLAKVLKIYSIVLDTDIVIDMSILGKITSVRHDIVHRNGKDFEGKPVFLSQNVCRNSISEINTFIDLIYEQISKSECQPKNK